VVAVVEALGLDDLILVGHSMGGPVALLAAERLGDRVRGVVAVEALHDPDLSFDPDAMAPFLELMDEDYDRFWEVNVQSALPPDTDPAIADRILEAARATPVAVARGLMLSFADYSASEVLARCEVPVRCVNGTLNPTRTEASRELHPDFDAVVLPGVGHFPMFEVPGELHAALARIVDELEGT
jgi:pimeloyl-ACP methyl ester carboxylesterase